MTADVGRWLDVWEFVRPAALAVAPNGEMIATWAFRRWAPQPGVLARVEREAGLWLVDPRRGSTAPLVPDRVWGAAWSPDGERLAFLRGPAGDERVWTWHRKSGALSCLSPAPVFALDTSDRPQWAPDGSALVLKLRASPMAGRDHTLRVEPEGEGEGEGVVPQEPQVLQHGMMRIGVGRLAAMDAVTGTVRTIADGISRGTFRFAPDGRHLAWCKALGRGFEVSVVEWPTGASLFTEPCAQLYGLSLAWAADGRRLAWSDMQQGLVLWDLQTGDKRALPGMEHPTHPPLWLSGAHLLCMAREPLWLVDAESGHAEEVPVGGRPLDLATDADRTTVVCRVRQPHDDMRLVRLGVADVLRGRLEAAEVPAPSIRVDEVAVLPGGDLVVAGTSPTACSTLWHIGAGDPTVLHRLDPDLSREHPYPERVLTYPDGSLAGVALLPETPQPPSGYPAVVLVYPGDDYTPFKNSRIYFVAGLGCAPPVLLERGYAVVLAKFPEIDPARPMASVGESVERLLDAVCRGAPVDPNRLALAGQSGGGALVNKAVCRAPRQRCAISSAGFAADAEADGSPVAEAGQVRVPVLLIAGDQDRAVPAHHGQRFYEALRAHGRTVRFIRRTTLRLGGRVPIR